MTTNFEPYRNLVTDVTNEQKPTVTTSTDHGYTVDQIVRLYVPGDHGMKINYVSTRVTSVPSGTTFVCDLSTADNDAFSLPTAPPAFTPAQVMPVSGVWDNNTSITG